MSLPLRVKVEKVKLLSNAEALKILKEHSEREREKTGAVSLLVQRVLEYLYKFNKVQVEKAEEFAEKLVAIGLREESIVMIMNMCPRSIDELLTLLVYEERVPEKEQLERILGIVSEYCVESRE
ncbi:MAG: RNA polymerase Rpb4 [Desulfurococcaceae archaeon]|nr:RNA polymerase Rpb4 [Desulfurococcaceae archaeon]